MQTEDSTSAAELTARQRWDRAQVARILADGDEAAERGESLRGFAAAAGVAESTLRHWQVRRDEIEADGEWVRFFESEAGMAFLHVAVLGLHFVFGQIGPCGVNMISAYLKLTGLARFVAASYGSQYGVASAMTDATIRFGQQERATLAAEMPRRQIAVAQDENFHQGVCLVAMEPSSGFILLEERHENREAATWTAAMEAATGDLPVEIVVAGSDEARALVSHIRQGLGALQAPDLFHMQREPWWAMEPALTTSLKQPAEALAQAEATTETWQAHKANYWSEPRGPGRPPDFDRHIAEAQAAQDKAAAAHQAALDRQAEAHAAIRGISQIYHPVDLATGAARDAATLADQLDATFAVLDQTADAVDLSDKARRHLDKARRILPKMVALLAFFWAHVDRALATLALSPEALALAREALIPGLYLQAAASRAATPQERQALTGLAESLLARARHPAGPLAALAPDCRLNLDRLAQDAVALFVRATSGVEGRNGRLALLHHGLHRLNPKRLAALTIIHNFVIRRPDGSTAANRFFHQPHRDLFAYLLDHMDLPARPRRHTKLASNISSGCAML